MKKQEAIYEREILVSSDNEIGVFKVRLYGERIQDKLVVLLTSKFDQNPKDFIEQLVINVESEIFKRINIDMVKNVQILLLSNQGAYRVLFEKDSPSSVNHIQAIDMSYLDGLEY